MSKLSAEFDRFMRFSDFAFQEEGRDVIVAKPIDATVQEEMLRETRLAGIANEKTTIDALYDLFTEEGFREEIIEEASRLRPALVRQRETKGE